MGIALAINWKGPAGSLGVLIAALVGSIALIPGPIAYPLAGMLLQSGVSYTVLATFVTTLMMVGMLTYPVERCIEPIFASSHYSSHFFRKWEPEIGEQ